MNSIHSTTENPETQRPVSHEALLDAPEQVLSTLRKDGTRRWLYPKLSRGFWWHRRRIVAYALMLIFVLIPHIQVAGGPLLRLDIVHREFTFFGQTFYPTDTLLLALILVAFLVSIAFISAVAGRAWCGWACPQTVYMEFLFRPIDRLFEGTYGKGGNAKRPVTGILRVLRLGVYLSLCMFLAHTFLAYFVGPENLSNWILKSTPWKHPVAFLVMMVTTGLMIYDFYFFREQTCLIACPYGRFQSVMLDKHSLIVAYDYNRGEPRQKGKRHDGDGKGHCVDCHQCVVVCPTGIDIRNGLQMECINCTQCIDACDSVMQKVGLPTGLIRFSSQAALEKKSIRLVRIRTVFYPLVLLAVGIAFLFALRATAGFTANVIRATGSLYTAVEPQSAMNRFRIKLTNRSKEAQEYKFTMVSPERAEIQLVDDSQLKVNARSLSSVDIRVLFPRSLTAGKGHVPAVVKITDTNGVERDVSFKLLGPNY